MPNPSTIQAEIEALETHLTPQEIIEIKKRSQEIMKLSKTVAELQLQIIEKLTTPDEIGEFTRDEMLQMFDSGFKLAFVIVNEETRAREEARALKAQK